MSSEHVEKFGKFKANPHTKHESQKQVWKGSEERNGKRRAGNEEEKHKKNKRAEKEMEVKKRKKLEENGRI